MPVITERPRQAASGSDDTGTLTVRIDDRGLFTGIEVRTLPEQLRASDAFATAFDQALTAAHANAYPPAPVPPDGRPVRARRVRRPERVPLRPIVEEAVRHRDHAAVRSRPRPAREHGVSDNDCVTVTLDLTGPTGHVEVDQAWLPTAATAKIAAAVEQAFAAAYQERGER
jgi:hypothetical protein